MPRVSRSMRTTASKLIPRKSVVPTHLMLAMPGRTILKLTTALNCLLSMLFSSAIDGMLW